jgi:uncharacterized protein YegL
LTSSDKVILFLTDGNPTDDQEEILLLIRRENAKYGNKVVIHTYGLGGEGHKYTIKNG